MRISSTTRGMNPPRTRLSGGGSSLSGSSANVDPAGQPAADGQPPAGGQPDGGQQPQVAGQPAANGGGAQSSAEGTDGQAATNGGQTTSNKQQQKAKSENRRASERAIKTTLVLGASAAAAAGGIALLSGGGGDDDRLQARNQKEAAETAPNPNGSAPPPTGGGASPAPNGGAGGGGGETLGKTDGDGGDTPPAPTVVDTSPLADEQRSETAAAENKDKREPSRDLKYPDKLEVTDVRRDNNGQVIHGRVGNQEARLEITPTRTRLVVDDQPRGEFSTLALMDAAQRVQDGDTLRQARNNNLWGDLLKNPWFFVALALAVYAFTRRR